MNPRLLPRICLLALFLACNGLLSAARAKAPTWDAIWTAGGAGATWVFGTAADASGSVFATGRFASFYLLRAGEATGKLAVE